MPQREEGREEEGGAEGREMESAPHAHLIEGAEEGALRDAHATAREAGCTMKRTRSVFSKTSQSSLLLRALACSWP